MVTFRLRLKLYLAAVVVILAVDLQRVVPDHLLHLQVTLGGLQGTVTLIRLKLRPKFMEIFHSLF